MTLTPRGVAFAVAGAAGLAAGLAFDALAAGVLGVALLAALGLAAASVVAPRATVERAVSATLTREEADVDVVLAVEAKGTVEIEDEPPVGATVAAGAARATVRKGRHDIRYTLRPTLPGRVRVGPARARATDAWGLVAREVVLDEGAPLVVHPRVDALKDALVESATFRVLAGDHLTGMGGRGSTFFALREYRDGDSVREVNWKASARHGRSLIVNQREIESHARVVYLVDGRDVARVGTRGRNAWIAAQRAVAHLATAGFRRRDRSVLAVYGPDSVRVLAAAGGDPATSGLVDALLDQAPAGSRGLRAAVDDLGPGLTPKSAVVVVSSFLDDPSVREAVFALRALDQRVTVVAMRAPDLLAAAGEPDVDDARASHARLLDELRAMGARVLDWDPADAFPVAVLKEAGP